MVVEGWRWFFTLDWKVTNSVRFVHHHSVELLESFIIVLIIFFSFRLIKNIQTKLKYLLKYSYSFNSNRLERYLDRSIILLFLIIIFKKKITIKYFRNDKDEEFMVVQFIFHANLFEFARIENAIIRTVRAVEYGKFHYRDAISLWNLINIF